MQRLVDGFRRGGKAALQDRKSETNAAAVCAIEVVSAVELLLHIRRYVGIQLRLHGRQIIIDGVGEPFREKGCAIKLQQVFLHQAPHDIADINGLIASPACTLKSVRVNQRHEELKVFLFTIMGSGSKQKEMACNAGKQAAQLIALGVFDLPAPHGSGHLVGFIADDQVPIGNLQLFLQLSISCELVQTGNAEVHFGEDIAGDCGFQTVTRENLKSQMKLLKELILPLLGQITGGNNQTTLQVTTDNQLFKQ